MPRVIRSDRGAAVTLRSPKKTQQGYLRADGMATRAGVFAYPDRKKPGGVRLELRPEDEVFSPAHLESFRGAPVTDDHPPQMIDAENHRKYAVGTVLTPGERADGDHVAVSMDISDATTQRKVRAKGTRELSPGYAVDLDETPGVDPKYGRYDAVQRNILVNHLAIVPVARAGHTARIRMDGVGVALDEGVRVEPGRTDATCAPAGACQNGVRNMAKTDDQNKAALEAATSELAREKMRADALDTQLASERDRADTALGLVKGLEAKVEQMEAERIDSAEVDLLKEQVEDLTTKLNAAEKARTDAADPVRLKDQIDRRVDVEMAGREFLGITRFDAMDNREIMSQVCHKLRAIKFDKKDSEATVAATFKITVEDARKNAEANRRIRQVVTENRADRAAETPQTAREKRDAQIAADARSPLPNSRAVASAKDR